MSQNEDLSLGWSGIISFFALIIVWSFLGLMLADQILLQLAVDPFLWLSVSMLLMTSYIVPISLVSWRLKDSFRHIIPEWTFVIRDVGVQEYEQMMKEYISAYPLLISIHHRFRYAIVVLLAHASLIIPYSMSQMTLDTIILAPLVFGGLLSMLGIALVASLLPAMPGPLATEFPIYPIRPYRKAMVFLNDIPGFYWLGITLTVGEWSGYYTLREPSLSGRIDGIESIVAIQFQIDTKGRIIEMNFGNESEHKLPITEHVSNPSRLDIVKTIRVFLEWYMEISNEKEILQEVLDELNL